jgi:hypothetical protein
LVWLISRRFQFLDYITSNYRMNLKWLKGHSPCPPEYKSRAVLLHPATRYLMLLLHYINKHKYA